MQDLKEWRPRICQMCRSRTRRAAMKTAAARGTKPTAVGGAVELRLDVTRFGAATHGSRMLASGKRLRPCRAQEPVLIRGEAVIVRTRRGWGPAATGTVAKTLIAGVLLVVAACPAEGQVTFSRDVAPIIFEHCTACHRAGEIGPFPPHLVPRRAAARVADRRRHDAPCDAAVEAARRGGSVRRCAGADRRANRDDSRLGGARRRRRKSRRPAAVARMAHGMAARHSGCRRADAAAVHAAG